MAEQRPENNEAPAPKDKKRFPVKIVGIVAGVAVLQGAVFFFVFKSAGARPESAKAEPAHALEPAPEKPAAGVAEVQLLHAFKVPNDKSGRMCIYDIDLSVVVAGDQKDKMKKIVETRAGEIADCVARIVRAATDTILREDDLRVLRSQLTEALNEIVQSKDLIQRVLIPRFVPIPV